MSKHKALTGAIAALASVATLGALAAPALAADTTYSPNGKPVAELAKHGGAQRIATIGNKNAKNVILFLGDGMGDSEITVARDYLKGANGHFDGLDAVGQPSALDDVQAGTGQYTTFSVGNGSKDSAVGKDGDGKLVANPNPGKLTPVTDSSASGSSWATGTKTYNNAVDVDVYGNPQLNLFGAGQGGRQGHRQRDHRRNPGRHPGRAGIAFLRAFLLRPAGQDRRFL